MPNDVGWEFRAYGPLLGGTQPAIDGSPCSWTWFGAPKMDPEVRLTIVDDSLICARLELDDGELERWEVLMHEALPLEPWHTRELAKQLGPAGLVPVRPLHDASDLLTFLTAVRSLGRPRSFTCDGVRSGEAGRSWFSGRLTVADRAWWLVRGVGPDRDRVLAEAAEYVLPDDRRRGGVRELVVEAAS